MGILFSVVFKSYFEKNKQQNPRTVNLGIRHPFGLSSPKSCTTENASCSELAMLSAGTNLFSWE